MINKAHKKIGIWGYGVVGKAALQYLQSQTCHLSVYDQKELLIQEKKHLAQQHITVYPPKSLSLFMNNNDSIIPSPGIDLSTYEAFKHKWLSEIDLFANAWHKPIIAVTGTVGKTTVTYLLTQLFNALNIPITVGGNIGVGMLDLIPQQKNVHYALLELSSWQLEQNTACAPTIALWTNFSENHLDRHKSMANYFDAKYQILAHQSATDYAILPLALLHQIYEKKPKSACIFFHDTKPHEKNIASLQENHRVIYYHGSSLHLLANGTTKTLCKNVSLPSYSFTQNWIAIYALLYALKLPIHIIESIDFSVLHQQHRLEYVCTRNGALFYNDSKSTTPASTIASVEKFKGKRIHLFLGGLSKGIDRRPLIKAIKNNTTYIYCFGQEANLLRSMCNQENISSYAHNTLNAAFKQCIKNCQPKDIVLFSPSGSSFDLFKNYEERGNIFNKMALNDGLSSPGLKSHGVLRPCVIKNLAH